MTRLFTFSIVFALFGMGLSWTPPEVFDDAYFEEQNRNAACDNHCFDISFPGGSCTDDAACMCTQQAYREKYFCCLGKQCAPSVLPDSIERQDFNCGAFGKPYTFDSEAACGIKLPASTWVAPTVTVTVTSNGQSSASTLAASSPTGALTITGTQSPSEPSSSSSTKTVSSSTTSSSLATTTTTTTPPPNGASSVTDRVVMKGFAALFFPVVVLLW